MEAWSAFSPARAGNMFRRNPVLSARAMASLLPALPTVLLDQFHGPRNVSASAL